MIPGADITTTIATMLGALLAVVGLMMILLMVAKRWFRHTPSMLGGRLIQVVASQPMGMKKSIALVEIPGAVLVVGMTGDRMTRLGTITDPDALAQIHQQTQQRPISFSQQLRDWRKRLDPTSGSTPDPPAES